MSFKQRGGEGVEGACGRFGFTDYFFDLLLHCGGELRQVLCNRCNVILWDRTVGGGERCTDIVYFGGKEIHEFIALRDCLVVVW